MDSRVPALRRPREPLPQLASKFESVILDIASEFKKTASFNHAQTKGNERERPIRKFLEDHLPGSYAAVSGEIVDVHGNVSPQMDIIVYNKMKNPAFLSGGAYVLPAEAALVTVEVKSILTTEELKVSVVAAQKLRQLRPLGRPLAGVRQKGVPADGQFRYFHCVFAYATDLAAGPNWGLREFERYVKISHSKSVPTDSVDRLYVADRGILIPAKGNVLLEEERNGRALLQFFLHIMNFILREDSRRPPVDYTNYSGTRGWKQLALPMGGGRASRAKENLVYQ